MLRLLTRWLPKSGYKTANRKFNAEGLSVPAIPQDLAAKMTVQGQWLFASRKIDTPPYFLQVYTNEFDAGQVEDYVLLSHDGHGVNSYAIQYYLVTSGLGLFLHLGWGGIYMDNVERAENIATCFSLADQLTSIAQSYPDFLKGQTLKIVASDFYGSAWSINDTTKDEYEAGLDAPVNILNSALDRFAV